MNYTVHIADAIDHFVGIEAEIETLGLNPMYLQLPAWRPGRYELGNFAKNIRKFTVKNAAGKAIPFKKVSKDCWEIHVLNEPKVYVSYEYYANQPDAGASFVGEQLLYLNPVNCFMYVDGRANEAFTLHLHIPDNWQIACQLPISGKTLKAQNFDQLADSPFFASPNLVHHSFGLNQTHIHFWFEGGQVNDMPLLEEQTRKYALAQTEIFGELPVKDFHFLYLILPDKFRHGVEHADSTVIAMGPPTGFNELDFYNDFLAISSHELFHLWNIKRMRPVELLPYDFTKENYSRLGYIYEGITTYYGDLMLLRSGVWDFETYAKSLASDLERHVNNLGRNHYSVADSSFDTWLDGYVPGVKGRKVSIYMEGLIAAWVADIEILVRTNGRYRLDEVLKRMYAQSYKQGLGYTQEMYKNTLEAVAGTSFEVYFEEIIDGFGQWDKYIQKTLEYVGLELLVSENSAGVLLCQIKKKAQVLDSQKALFEYWVKSV
ncbi:MAG: M61 family peptidase [Bacteroidota bacterium]|nr:M61 family peptidase [Bacteroidota bacterium]